MAQWEKKELKDLGVGFPPELTALFENFSSMGDSLTSVLDTASTALNVIKAFVTTLSDPIKLALLFICDQILQFIAEIRGSGFHIITLYPKKYVIEKETTKTVTQIVNGQPTEVLVTEKEEISLGTFKKFKDIYPGFDDNDERGMMFLNTTEIFDAFLSSFDDLGDKNRPGSIDPITGEATDVPAGGFLLFAGTHPSELQNIKKIVDIFKKIFDVGELKKLGEALDKINAATSDPKPVKRKAGASIPPDWKAVKLVEMVPPLGGVLDSLGAFIDGVKEDINKGADSLGPVIKFLDGIIAKIKKITTQINEVIALLDDFANASQNVSYLVIDSAPNGIENIKSVVGSAEDKPENLDYCMLIGVVGAGAGFSMIMNMLGLGTFQTGVDSDTLFNDDKLREKFGIPDNPLDVE